MKEIENYIREYLDYLEIEKNRSPKTRENYERYLLEFLKFSKIQKPKEITEELVRKFRIDLNRRSTDAHGKPRSTNVPDLRSELRRAQHGKPLKKITQNYYLIALRNFLKFLSRRNVETLAAEKIELPKISERQIEVIEYADLDRLLRAPREHANPNFGHLRLLRDRAILETFFSTGLRLAELCALNCDLDLSRGEVTVRGKGGKLRLVFLSNSARNSIKEYLRARGDADPALFISLAKGPKAKVFGRITTRSVQRLIDFWAKAAGISKKVHPHQLRHLFATDLLMNGADLRSVQALLGHANISTTQIYTHLTNKALREIHEAFHGRRRGKGK